MCACVRISSHRFSDFPMTKSKQLCRLSHCIFQIHVVWLRYQNTSCRQRIIWQRPIAKLDHKIHKIANRAMKNTVGFADIELNPPVVEPVCRGTMQSISVPIIVKHICSLIVTGTVCDRRPMCNITTLLLLLFVIKKRKTNIYNL